MREGKVYMPHQAGRALGNFFSKPNLTALRELALRTAASRVDAEVLALTRGAARASRQDRLMVCLTDPARARALVRAGRRMTDRARIPWTVAHVVTAQAEARGVAAEGPMIEAMQLAERLGAQTRTLHAERDVARAFLDEAARLNVTRLILGRRAPRGWLARLGAWFLPPVEVVLLDRATDYEVTALNPVSEPVPPPGQPGRRSGRDWPRILDESLAAAALGTLVAWPFWHVLAVASLAPIYLVGVLMVGMRLGSVGAVVASLFSFLA